jgi:hypothetical protein
LRGSCLSPDRLIRLEKEIAANYDCDRQYDGRSAKNDGPSRYNFFITLGLWLLALETGNFGLRVGAFRVDNGAIVVTPLSLTSALTLAGAAFF